MAADDLIIANLALEQLGEEPLAALDGSRVTAQAVQRNLPEARRFVLYGHPWKVALRLARLPANATPPEWGYARAFDLPSDCLRPWYVDGEAEGDGLWTVRGNQIVTDLPAPLNLEYIQNDAPASGRDPMLQKAIAIELARRMAPARTEDEGRGDRLDAAYEKLIREARSVSSIVGSQRRRIRPSQFELARFGGGADVDPIYRRISD